MGIPVIEKVVSVPPEWAPQKAVWTAWPWDAGEWDGNLTAPRSDVAALVRALSPHVPVRVLANGAEAEDSARAALQDHAEIMPARYGDIWLRDTGPVFARDARGPVALRFKTNGWGGKYLIDGDETVGDGIARAAGVAARRFDFVLEGGAIEHDGDGTLLTTRETLLNANRNGWNEREAEEALRHAFGVRKIIWLDRGLEHDHTDGHIDNLARFAGAGRVVCQVAAGADDPNADLFEEITATLEAATDARGRKLEVIRVPGPGRVLSASGESVPASHMNFVIANGVVAVPVFGTPSAEPALTALQAAFPDREVIGLPSRGLLGAGDAGGGSFHCITLNEPL
jgi:agmatine deiminase